MPNSWEIQDGFLKLRWGLDMLQAEFRTFSNTMKRTTELMGDLNTAMRRCARPTGLDRALDNFAADLAEQRQIYQQRLVKIR